MKRSTDRILTTHVGSLVRPREIIEGMKARTTGQPYDRDKLAEDIKRGVADVVRKQVEIGLDVVNDGEYGRRGYTSYIHERLTGLAPRSPDAGETVWGHDAERDAFPGFFERYDRVYRYLWMPPEVPMDDARQVAGNGELFRLVGPIAYRGQAAVQRDLNTLHTALEGHVVSDAFVTAVTPVSRKSDRDILEFYPSVEAYLYAIADAMHDEYTAITDAGFVLQLDYGALNPMSQMLKGKVNPTPKDIATAREMGVEITNHALRGIPQDMVRYHHCWGSHNRPHTLDAPLTDFVHQMLKLNVTAYGIEAANPRHEHEWMVWKNVKLPDGKVLMPGLISQSTNVVEHPGLIAWRIENFASVVGKENIIAGSDCGFSQWWDSIRLHPTVQWAKLKSLVDGAALASKSLWGHDIDVREREAAVTASAGGQER